MLAARMILLIPSGQLAVGVHCHCHTTVKPLGRHGPWLWYMLGTSALRSIRQRFNSHGFGHVMASLFAARSRECDALSVLS